MSNIKDISQKDKDILSASSGDMNYDPLESVEAQPVVPPAIEEVEESTATVANYEEQYSDILRATDALIELVDARCDGFSIILDPKEEPEIISAIRKVFGTNTNIITYDMYQQALTSLNELATTMKQDLFDQ